MTRYPLVLAFYLAVAVAATWPLASHVSTHLLGDPSGDAGVYVWNLWVFAREWRSATGPFVTDAIFSLTGGTDLALHNYTVASDMMAAPLVGTIGPIAAFNLVLIFQLALAATGVFALASHVTEDWRAALVAGFAFACSPVLSAKSVAHISLVAAAPLPLFALAVLRALHSRRWAWWALAAGLCLGWAGYSDAYYPVYCLVLLGAILAHRLLRLEPTPPAPPRWLVTAAIVAASAGVVILATGGTSLTVAGHTIHLRTAYTPMTVAMGCVLLVLAHRVLPRVRLSPDANLPRATGIVGVSAATAAAVLSPLLLAMVTRWMEGRWVEARVFWRSSPAGLDAAALVLPNPVHPLWQGAIQPLLGAWRPDAFPEHVGSLSLVALALVAALRLVNGRWWSGAGLWVGVTIASVLLSIGPFLTIAGFATGVPGPWSLLRFVPVLGWARSPTRFAVLATLGLSLLLAFAVRDLLARRRGRWIVAAATILLAAELLPAPRHLHAAAAPSIYEVIAVDPDPRVRVLELPAGVRDGTSSLGNFHTRSQYYQVMHGKPIVGGYLSRVSDLRRRRTMKFPTMRALVQLSAGAALTPEEDADGRFHARRFVLRSRIGYVVIVRDRVSPELRLWAIEALELVKIAEDGNRELFRPAAWPPPEPLPERTFAPDHRHHTGPRPAPEAAPVAGTPAAR